MLAGRGLETHLNTDFCCFPFSLIYLHLQSCVVSHCSTFIYISSFNFHKYISSQFILSYVSCQQRSTLIFKFIVIHLSLQNSFPDFNFLFSLEHYFLRNWIQSSFPSPHFFSQQPHFTCTTKYSNLQLYVLFILFTCCWPCISVYLFQ